MISPDVFLQKERNGPPGDFVTLPHLLSVPRASPAPHECSQLQPVLTALQHGLKALMQKILASSGYWGSLLIPTRGSLTGSSKQQKAAVLGSPWPSPPHPALRDTNGTCEDPPLRLLFPLSVLPSSFFSQNGWSQGCGLGLIFKSPGFCQ